MIALNDMQHRSGMQERTTKFFRPSRAGGEQSEPSREFSIISVWRTQNLQKYAFRFKSKK